MGEVYEAEHLEHGRRVALKVLRSRPRGVAERHRFFREGQLAASVHHPHCVYVFGSDEIAGTAVISMELLQGGTLRERVTTQGPLPPSEAVDAVLQVIAGLEAAYVAGVLHRDVKPSNCFIAQQGTIKVGDFGLSISTVARDASQASWSGAFQGTPQYASPEQLRGEALDVRADIYAVGATLFYLLTGRAPFEHDNLTALLTEIATAPPPSPRRFQPGVPRGLAQLVRRCLAKDRAERPTTYAELTDLLRPFSSAVATPAPWDARLTAGVFDSVIVCGAALVCGFFLGAARLQDPITTVPYASLLLVVGTVYWTVCEGIWGTSHGKRACGLQLIGVNGHGPGLLRALVRAGVFLMPVVVLAGFGDTDGLFFASTERQLAAWVLTGVTAMLLWLTARRRNGWRGLHDLLSGTQVVMRPSQSLPMTVGWRYALPDPEGSSRRVGPYAILQMVATSDSGHVLLAFDDRLRRRVWIHEQPPATPPRSARFRRALRTTQPTWLGGRRTDAEAWDAFEAPDGEPLATMLTSRVQGWSTVRQWLGHLAHEIHEGLQDDTVESLALDRVVVNFDGRAWLAEFPITGAVGGTCVPATVATAQLFLADIAERALSPSARLPVSVRRLLHRLTRAEFDSLAEVVFTLDYLERQPDRVTAQRRGMALALSVVTHVVSVVLMVRVLTLGAMREWGSASGVMPPADLALALVASLSILTAVVWRGGFWLRMLGIAVVTVNGTPISGPQAGVRALVAWSWVPVQVIGHAQGAGLLVLVAVVAKVAGLVTAAERPERGLHDQLVGTYLVPR